MSKAPQLSHLSVLEVAHSIGDTVEAVHVVGEAEPARVSRRLLFGIGLACLIVSSLTFARSVSNAATNEAGLHQWTEVQRRPVAEFRPTRLSVTHDVFAFGGLACALVCFGAGLALRRKMTSTLHAGSSKGDAIALADCPSFELVRVANDTASIALPSGVTATLMADDGKQRDVAGLIVLRPEHSLRAKTALGNLHFRWTNKPRRSAVGAVLPLDSRMVKFVAVSAMAHLAILSLLMMIPPDGRAMSLDSDLSDGRLVHIEVDASEDKRREANNGDASGAGGATELGEAVASTSGAKGDPSAAKKKTKAAINRRAAKPQLARYTPTDMTTVGVVGLLREDQFVAFTANNDFASGDALDDMFGNSFSGAELGAGFGPGGPWGTPDGRGVGPRGGIWGTIKGEIPGGTSVRGHDYGGKVGGLGTRQHVTRNPIIKTKAASCGVAGCNKALIGRYVRKHKRMIRNCYERALLGDSDLEGIVVSRFLIHPNGRVASSRASGVGNDKLESCIAKVVAQIKFPVVADGAIASVSYPWVLSQVGK